MMAKLAIGILISDIIIKCHASMPERELCGTLQVEQGTKLARECYLYARLYLVAENRSSSFNVTPGFDTVPLWPDSLFSTGSGSILCKACGTIRGYEGYSENDRSIPIFGSVVPGKIFIGTSRSKAVSERWFTWVEEVGRDRPGGDVGQR